MARKDGSSRAAARRGRRALKGKQNLRRGDSDSSERDMSGKPAPNRRSPGEDVEAHHVATDADARTRKGECDRGGNCEEPEVEPA